MRYANRIYYTVDLQFPYIDASRDSLRINVQKRRKRLSIGIRCVEWLLWLHLGFLLLQWAVTIWRSIRRSPFEFQTIQALCYTQQKKRQQTWNLKMEPLGKGETFRKSQVLSSIFHVCFRARSFHPLQLFAGHLLLICINIAGSAAF